MEGPREDRRTPLEKAVSAGDLDETVRLLRAGADPNAARELYRPSPLDLAAMRAGGSEMIRALIAAGANPNGREPEGDARFVPPLNHAASIGDIENVRTLLAAGAVLQQPPRAPCSKLVAAWLKRPMIEFLVEHGFDVHAIDENGRNELHVGLSSAVPSPESVEYLLHAGIPLDARDRFGKTPVDYWREPRDFERRWFTVWLIERMSDDKEFKIQRENRAQISKLLGVKL